MAVVIFAVLASLAARPQTLINGSFELGPAIGWGVLVSAGDNSTIAGWTVASGTVDYLGGGHWAAGDGDRCLDLSGISAGRVSQTISGFSPGLPYRLSFLGAGSPEGGQVVRRMQVSIGSLSPIFSFTGSGNVSNPGWSQRSVEFVATGATMTLSFASLEDGVFGPGLDAVRIDAVPEPGILCLWTMAFGLFAIARVRR